LGVLLQTQGKLSEAEPFYREALEGNRGVLGDDHPSTLTSINNLAGLLDQQSRWSESLEIRRLAVDIARRAEPEGGSKLGSALVQLGINLIAQNRHADAQPVLEECLEIRQRVLPNGHWLIWNTQSLLGETLMRQSKFAEAEDLLVEAAEQIGPPESFMYRRDEAIQRVVDLYTDWHNTQPNNGYDLKAQEWQQQLEPQTPPEP
jgi:tetratricopeptide (TPR) repeat protein